MKTVQILDYARQKSDRLIQRQFSASFMSDRKWVKLLHALTEIGEKINYCEVKLVWDETVREMWIAEYTSYRFDYYDHAMEAMITGYPKGWYDYKEIEWIRFDAGRHDLEVILQVIQVTGKFMVEKDSESLTLYAYK